ncbi:6-pyruvoyl tetrahydrobiopterin synthase [Ectothiorhodospira haloalkaliphila]|uniref:6-carboxy-5,6,7,8-tetrahydropterin synthase n=1 Tax=Ectothiorhodospira haloalkaliphila TaxID=421628 RepID=W8KGP0_9GAMM|nr:6-carboxytetrahydropterin synthase QueD [Ectothiorhodospira haloalkaliphila]AHK78343.1 6-pyruvoyl tetrahydrobiopterin synthase [Ectothiorhodospira haloalkaliphila]MCG5525990.1 6-carboxytetrahydropterin synthase QueD [Ectothiorhodospira haloalkaliphila]
MSKYTLKVLTDFASAHTLRDYPGDCARLHGHNWKVEAEVEASRLDRLGMAVDFKTIKGLAREIAGQLDHQYLNDLEPFRDVNPTAENIAQWFFREMAARLDAPNVRVSAITLWETERACVRYSEDQSKDSAP